MIIITYLIPFHPMPRLKVMPASLDSFGVSAWYVGDSLRLFHHGLLLGNKAKVRMTQALSRQWIPEEPSSVASPSPKTHECHL